MKKFFRVLIITFSLWIGLLSPTSISLVYAQTVTPSPSPTPTSLPTQVATPTASGTPLDTPTSSPAASAAVTPTDTPTASPSATSEQSITTGNATSQTTTQTTTNANIISGSPTPTDSATPTATASADPSSTPIPDTSTLINQSSNISSSTSSNSQTGQNSQTSSGSGQIKTGAATSVSNSVNVTNLNAVDSNLIKAVQTVLTAQGNDINLYQLLINAIAANPNSCGCGNSFTATQSATVSTNITANSETGGNSQTGGSAKISTGDAIAIANAINAVNLSLFNSNAVFAIINILSNYSGNIILPNGSVLVPSTSEGSGSGGDIKVMQSANVSSTTNSSSSTGNNSQSGGNNQILTGNGVSLSNSGSFVNVVKIGSGWTFLIINNAGGWSGNLVNWTAPGSIQSFGPGAINLAANITGSGTGNCPTCNSGITIDQSANVTSNVSANAGTGNNTQSSGNSTLSTGSAFSIANNFNLTNITGIGSGFLFGIINILGNWSGSIITAYPELKVSLTDNQDTINPGDSENYVLTVKNSGYAIAHNVTLDFSWPISVNPDSNQNTNWNLGNLNPGQSQTFNLTGHVSNSAQNGAQLYASANAGTVDTQDSTNGNSASDTTTVVIPPDPPADTRTPDLSVSIWNNVGAFVYPGDTVLANMIINNKSPFVAHSVEIFGKLTNDHPMPAIPMNWKIGDMKANSKVKISFSVQLIKNLPDGTYKLWAQASGKSDSGNTITTDWVASDFLVKVVGGQVSTQNPESVLQTNNINIPPTGSVLGTNTAGLFSDVLGKYFPYIFAALGVFYLLILGARRKLNGLPLMPKLLKKKKFALADGILTILITIGLFIKKNILA